MSLIEGNALPSGRDSNPITNSNECNSLVKNFEACFNHYEGINLGNSKEKENLKNLGASKVCNTETNQLIKSDDAKVTTETKHKPSTALGKSDFSEDFRAIRHKLQQKKTQNQEKKSSLLKDNSNIKENSTTKDQIVLLTTSINRLNTNSSQPKPIKAASTTTGKLEIQKEKSMTASTKPAGTKGATNYQSLKTASNKNTISSIGNSKASITLKNRRVGSTNGNTVKIMNLITSPKPNQLTAKKDAAANKSSSIPSSSKNIQINNYNKLVLNNNDFIKKQHNFYSEPNQLKEPVKIDLTGKDFGTKKGKIEERQINKNIFAEGILKESDYVKPKIHHAVHSRKSSLDQKQSTVKHTEDSNYKDLVSSPQITGSSQNFKPKQIGGSSVASNYKNILQNTKINVIKHSQILKQTTTNSKAITPKICNEDKQLVNQTSRKSLSGNCKNGIAKKPNTSCAIPISSQPSTTNHHQSTDINYGSKMKFAPSNQIQVRPGSKIADKVSKVEGSIIKKNVAYTEKSSPKIASKRVSASKITGYMNNHDALKTKVKDQSTAEDRLNLPNNTHQENNSYIDKDHTASNSFQKECDTLVDFIKSCKPYYLKLYQIIAK